MKSISSSFLTTALGPIARVAMSMSILAAPLHRPLEVVCSEMLEKLDGVLEEE
jgi:hypothetical protein